MRHILAAVLVLATALPALAQDKPNPEDNPIVQAMLAFRDAYNAGDVDALMKLYAPDAVLLMPQSKEFAGADAIRQQYTEAFSKGITNLRLNMREIKQVGPTSAIEISETLIDASGRTVHGRHMHVWIQTEDGWLLSRDMYHVLAVRDPE